jgi:protocatechuate 3,4-dioxygenase, beta subunit
MHQISPRVRTPDQILGPYFPVGRQPCTNGDLTTVDGGVRRARGRTIEVAGRVLTTAGNPVAGARLMIWQANAYGRYAHPNDTHDAPLDPNFAGFADISTDRNGMYWIRTVMPGAYPISSEEMRAPHIHFEVHGRFERLITQIYFPGESLNATDRFLSSALYPDLLIAGSAPSGRGDGGNFTFDIVLARG